MPSKIWLTAGMRGTMAMIPQESIGYTHRILEETRNGYTCHGEGLEAICDLTRSDKECHGHGEFGPHVWQDPVLAVQPMMNMRGALTVADPYNVGTCEQNAAAYASQLDGLHGEYAAPLPAYQNDTIAPFHATLTYLAGRYGFERSRSPTYRASRGSPDCRYRQSGRVCTDQRHKVSAGR